jgi:hypothetical protein
MYTQTNPTSNINNEKLTLDTFDRKLRNDFRQIPLSEQETGSESPPDAVDVRPPAGAGDDAGVGFPAISVWGP